MAQKSLQLFWVWECDISGLQQAGEGHPVSGLKTAVEGQAPGYVGGKVANGATAKLAAPIGAHSAGALGIAAKTSKITGDIFGWEVAVGFTVVGWSYGGDGGMNILNPIGPINPRYPPAPILQ